MNDQIVAAMAASSFSVIEKYMCLACAPVNHGAEQKVIAAASLVRAVNPNATMVFYFAVDYTRTWCVGHFTDPLAVVRRRKRC